ncbi:MAG: CGNR zinc finger domain-containing protein [Kordiimonadaceae bacterium]|nr:CGNR zinc finger domain-containing protein [Kordiimonadaceae bacterium]
MTVDARPEPFFIADDAALDFLNSIASPWGKDIEWLENGVDFVNWLETAGLIPGHAATFYRDQTSSAELDAVTEEARALREWFRTYVSSYGGGVLPVAAQDGLSKINQILAGGARYTQILIPDEVKAAGDPIMPSLGAVQRWRGVDDLLLPLADVMAKLICEAGFERVKNCEGPTCTMWFNDISKNHTRRWCTMSVCGNRAKAAAFRAKKKSSAS